MSTPGKLDGKVAVITGGTEGMGLATAELFIAEGAHVYITGRRKEVLNHAVGRLGPRATGVAGDIADRDDLARLADAVRSGHGYLDVLFASAGIGRLGESVRDVTPESFDEVFGVNVRGTLFTVQTLLPLLRTGGSIILNGSTAAVKGLPGTTVYAASKAALRSFARTWASDLAPDGIRVNIIQPGSIDTASIDQLPPKLREQIVAMIPADRFGRPDEIATAVLFLASSDAGYVTGAELFVDGGMVQV